MLKPIKNNEEYEDALESIFTLMQKSVEPGTAEGDELEVLSILVKEYEYEHFPVPKPNLEIE